MSLPQLALDYTELPAARAEAVQPHFDCLEVGTPRLGEAA